MGVETQSLDVVLMKKLQLKGQIMKDVGALLRSMDAAWMEKQKPKAKTLMDVLMFLIIFKVSTYNFIHRVLYD